MTDLSTQKARQYTRSRFLRDAGAVLLLWALVLACFWRIALAGRVLAGGDVFTYFYPYWAEAARAMRAGRLPLWNPYLFMGVPFLANSQVGFFYPLNWPLWLLLPVHRAIHLTLVLHLCLAAFNAYLWGRVSLRLKPVGAWTMGAIFALGGYLGAQVEHVNQLQGLAWLPLLLVLYDKAASWQVRKSAGRQVCRSALAGLSVVVALVVLAGHTQTAFISLVGLASYGLGPALLNALRRGAWRALTRRTMLLALAVTIGIALAAVQWAPTWELSRLSVRAEGLPFNERLSFSLSPLYMARALLPGFADAIPPVHIEHVAYVGVAGLALAGIAVLQAQGAQFPVWILTVLGLFFALGLYNPLYLLLARYVPGFAHFRVPARWLALYVLGVAGLAGEGVQTLWDARERVPRRTLYVLAGALLALMAWAVIGGHFEAGTRLSWWTALGWVVGAGLTMALLRFTHRSRLVTIALLTLLIAELFAASATLPHTRATAPQAFTDLRPSIAHLLASSADDASERVGGERFISMSDITFDPGDLPEIEIIYGPQLSDRALYDYIIAAKQKEVLSPNLPLAFGVPAVDGYDGGVLPLMRYVTLQRLFLPDDRVSIDGRLRENLTAIPDGRWLSLFNVRYVITDKLHDVWLDDVFYDLQFGAQLARGEEAAVAHVPRFEATALGLVTHLRDEATLSDDTSVGVVELGFRDGTTRAFDLEARDVGDGGDVTRLRWSEPRVPLTVTVRATLPQGELIVRGASLIDERTGSFQSLVLSDRGRFRLVHSGDVKIYENLNVLPRAFVVHSAEVVADDEAALAAMRDPAFDPAATVILSTNAPSCSDYSTGRPQRTEAATMVSYRANRVVLDVSLDEPGYLVLTDAWYPGWEVAVDGEPAPICRADLLFRAVQLEAGSHRVTFAYRPKSLRVGVAISLAGMIVLSVAAVLCPKYGRML